METEITRQMWADLLGEQPSLPADPSHTTYSPTLAHPVQQNTWYESVLFANLLSLENGYTRCYYTDAGFTTPIDASNYTSGRSIAILMRMVIVWRRKVNGNFYAVLEQRRRVRVMRIIIHQVLVIVAQQRIVSPRIRMKSYGIMRYFVRTIVCKRKRRQQIS